MNTNTHMDKVKTTKRERERESITREVQTHCSEKLELTSFLDRSLCVVAIAATYWVEDCQG